MSDRGLLATGIEYAYPAAEWRLRVPSFQSDAGRMIAILGPNGAGKSTLLRIIAGFLQPQAGTVTLGDVPLASLDRRSIARQLGYLPQHVETHFDFRVEDVVAMGRYPHVSGFGGLRDADRRVIDQCLAQTGMAALRTRRLSRLSGGEQKRAFLASVLAQQPHFLLLDEPTAALDVHHQVEFFRLLRSFAQAGMGIVVVTHETNLASLFCDTVLLLDKGIPFAEGCPADVLTPAKLTRLYDKSIFVHPHPEGGAPMVLPRMNARAESEGGSP